MNIARAMLALSATSSKSTRPAPTAASVTMKNIDNPAPSRAGWPGRHTRKVQMRSTTTARSAMPLVRRCENSIRVAVSADRGRTSPLQSGQCAPQPAPDPVARTYAPHRMTATVYKRAPQANRAAAGIHG
jgi:hypothetical protein